MSKLSAFKPGCEKTVMPRFYFRVAYDGDTYDDETGDFFATLEEARAHGAAIARELGRNNTKAVTVFVIAESGETLASASAP